MRLHITNGDSTVPGIKAFDPGGVILPWRDILHEGPVPGGIGPDLLAEVRSAHLEKAGYTTFDAAIRSFRERRDLIRRAGEFEEVVLWFEHDLYDQLQIVEALADLRDLVPLPSSGLICIDRFAGVERFFGLGQLTHEQIASLYPSRIAVDTGMLDLAARAWEAFRESDPRNIEALSRDGNGKLPFLAPALLRLLRELPDSNSGLTETESIVLGQLADGPETPHELFKGMQDAEAAPFLGNASFWTILAGLVQAATPAVETVGGATWPSDPAGFARPEFREIRLALTNAGRRIRNGELDFVRLNGVDRWLGGTHLDGREAIWRWDRTAARTVRA